MAKGGANQKAVKGSSIAIVDWVGTDGVCRLGFSTKILSYVSETVRMISPRILGILVSWFLKCNLIHSLLHAPNCIR